MSHFLSHHEKIVSRQLRIGSDRVRYLSGFECTPMLGAALADELSEHRTVLMVVDRRARLHAEALLADLCGGPAVALIEIDPGERNKRLSLVEDLLQYAVANGIGRASAVLAMGGGLTGNIAGMVAALLYRGLPLIHLPTTPVAAFDSVLSAKQAVNLSQGKNLCGTFRTPALIACDLAWLTTVPEGQMAVGLAEMAKNVLAVVPNETERLIAALEDGWRDPEGALRSLLDIGIGAKSGYLAIDPFEKNQALVFEYGHTVGHAIEFASQGLVPHGEAIAWGMLVAAEIAAETHELPDVDRKQHYRLFSALKIDDTKVAKVNLDLVKELLRTDNKRGYLRPGGDDLAMVLLRALGEPVTQQGRPLVPVPLAEVETKIDLVLSRSGGQ